MGTFDSVYKNKIRQLEEENNKLKTALRMIFEADGDYEIFPLAPYEQDFGDAFPNSPNPSNISPRPTNFPNPQGIPFWKWVRQLGNPINFEQWQQWVDQWGRANPGQDYGPKPWRYDELLRPNYDDLQRLPRQPPVQPWELGPGDGARPTKPGWGGRLWRAIKPLVTQGPTQNNPAQTTASSAPRGNSQPEVM